MTQRAVRDCRGAGFRSPPVGFEFLLPHRSPVLRGWTAQGLRDLRFRLTTARAAVAITPELAETLVRDGWRVARVNATVLADVEQQVMTLRALHLKLRQADEGPSFGEVVARSPPGSEIL